MVNAKLIDCLSSLYVFNPDYCQRDGDEPKKVLFYYPKEKPLDAQVQDVGFAEASVRFSDTFGGQQAPDMYEWSSGRFVSVCRRPEPRFYIGATFARQQATNVGYPLRADVIGEVLARAYHLFRLFFGGLQQLVDKAGLESTKQRLEFFFNRYISSSKLSCTLIPDLIDGMRYLRIDRQSVFKLITLVDEAVEMFPFIHWNMLLYNDCLLHNSIPTASVTTFYRYITTMLIPLTARSELRPEVLFSGKGCSILDDEQQQKQPEQQQRYGHFFSTSEGQSLADGQLAARRLPTVHLRVECNKPEKEYGLAVYRLLNFTWAMVVPKCGDDERGQAEVGHLFAEFDRRFGPSIDSLVCKLTDAYDVEQQWPSSTVPSGGGGGGAGGAATVAEGAAKTLLSFGSTPEPFCCYYIYHDATTGEMRSRLPTASSNCGTSPSVPGTAAPGAEVWTALCDLGVQLAATGSYFVDLVAKADSDWWVAAKKSGHRRLYLTLYAKNASLTDVGEELRRLCASHFDGDFLNE
ncbi:Vacuolar fusion protein CCZ1 -like protein [Trichinella patagoniensis]|uniref:Vacuolar fusion protein CCZ1-like protein n=1 Tax=Trichinella patagoniensis TaxID=990121 RepID=A0A0V1A8A2_9BILA|nr:Vacuolar fusion protein CCZ1 -like protein [Trichinella patagoniensis]